MNADAIKAIKEELPDDPQELEKFAKVKPLKRCIHVMHLLFRSSQFKLYHDSYAGTRRDECSSWRESHADQFEPEHFKRYDHPCYHTRVASCWPKGLRVYDMST